MQNAENEGRLIDHREIVLRGKLREHLSLCDLLSDHEAHKEALENQIFADQVREDHIFAEVDLFLEHGEPNFLGEVLLFLKIFEELLDEIEQILVRAKDKLARVQEKQVDVLQLRGNQEHRHQGLCGVYHPRLLLVLVYYFDAEVLVERGADLQRSRVVVDQPEALAEGAERAPALKGLQLELLEGYVFLLDQLR